MPQPRELPPRYFYEDEREPSTVMSWTRAELRWVGEMMQFAVENWSSRDPEWLAELLVRTKAQQVVRDGDG
jgi:hypothetical protein